VKEVLEMGQMNSANEDSGQSPATSSLQIPEYLVLGAFCIVVGIGAIWIAREYPYGTLTAMGPGFVPTAIAAILVVLGILIIIMRGRDVREEAVEEVQAGTSRPSRAMVLFGIARVLFFVLGGIVFFGVALRALGLAISTFILVILVSLARPGVKLLPVLLLAAGVTAASYVLFILLLDLQINVFPRF
jgi:hypothetical protein